MTDGFNSTINGYRLILIVFLQSTLPFQLANHPSTPAPARDSALAGIWIVGAMVSGIQKAVDCLLMPKNLADFIIEWRMCRDSFESRLGDDPGTTRIDPVLIELAPWISEAQNHLVSLEEMEYADLSDITEALNDSQSPHDWIAQYGLAGLKAVSLCRSLQAHQLPTKLETLKSILNDTRKEISAMFHKRNGVLGYKLPSLDEPITKASEQ